MLRARALFINTQAQQAHSQPAEMTEAGDPRPEDSKDRVPIPGHGTPTMQTPATLPCRHSWIPVGSLIMFGTTITSYFPNPTADLFQPQPRVPRVEARLCEQGMWGRREENHPPEGAGRPGTSQSCPGGSRAFDQGWPLCQLLGRPQAWGCGCAVIGGLLGCGGTSKDMARGRRAAPASPRARF